MYSDIFLKKTLKFVFSFIVTISVVLLVGGCTTRMESVKKIRYPKKPQLAKYTSAAAKYTSAARHKVTMRSYKVLGKRYYPCYVEEGEVLHGISSWYGPNFHGKYTSNGEVYDMYAKTAAHKTLPMDTMVKVTNKQNGKSTIVRINDRGPFVRGRIIDCSYTAGKEIGLDKLGIAKVDVEVLAVTARTPGKNAFKIKKMSKTTGVKQRKYAVQEGSFSRREGAEVTRHRYETIYSQHKPVVKRFVGSDAKVVYRVLLLGFDSEEEAKDFKHNNNI